MKAVEKTQNKNPKKYIYLVIFFLIFSFFVFFAVRPSLVTAFSLVKEESELKRMNVSYEGVIEGIVNIQTQLQENQDRVNLLSEALPDNPQLNKVLGDIEALAGENSVTIKKFSVDNISLVKRKNVATSAINTDLEVSASFEDILNFVKALHNQRRVESVTKLDISKGEIGTASATINVLMKISSFHL